jgi:hypothetical protein
VRCVYRGAQRTYPATEHPAKQRGCNNNYKGVRSIDRSLTCGGGDHKPDNRIEAQKQIIRQRGLPLEPSRKSKIDEQAEADHLHSHAQPAQFGSFILNSVHHDTNQKAPDSFL